MATSPSSSSQLPSESTTTKEDGKGNDDRRHPFANSKGLLIVIPDDKIDVAAESAFYDDFCQDDDEAYAQLTRRRSRSAPPSPQGPAPSIFSHDIWLGDNCGESRAFARSVVISGWTNVGDKLGGAYVVYDCQIRTSQSTTIHAHKRYSAFLSLHTLLHRTLPPSLHPHIPPLPPKAPLAKYRLAFLDKRRRALQYWLSAVLLHPDIGGCEAVREWVMD